MTTLAGMLQTTVAAGDSTWLIAGFALFGLALVLLALEFVLPSAGLIAVLCVLSVGAGVVCFFVHAPVWGVASLAVSLGGAPFAIGYGLRLWSSTPLARRAVLGAQLGQRPQDRPALPAAGARGTADTALRPVGRVRLEGRTFEAIAEDGFVDPGAPVVVVTHEAGTLRVRRAPEA